MKCGLEGDKLIIGFLSSADSWHLSGLPHTKHWVTTCHISLSLSLSLPLSQVISGLFYNTAMMLELLEKTHFPDSPEPVTAQFFTQWVKDATADLYTG